MTITRHAERALKLIRIRADKQRVTEEHRALEVEGATKEFSTIRKGYDPAEVEKYLAEYDDAFRDLEEYAARLKRELREAKLEIARLHSAEQDSIDNAMRAVFDAKDRIIQGAMDRARLIEEQARSRAGLDRESQTAVDAAEPVAQPTPVQSPEPGAGQEGDELLSDLTEMVGEPPSVMVQPTDVLQQMLQEAESIRNRLDDGLAAAFDQMEQMQRDAELRAAHLLSEARREASTLRASASSETSIEVSLTDDAPPVKRPSRYSRNSAGLPRIGDEEGDSVLAKMNSLRTKMRKEEDGTDDDAVATDVAG